MQLLDFEWNSLNLRQLLMTITQFALKKCLIFGTSLKCFFMYDPRELIYIFSILKVAFYDFCPLKITYQVVSHV